MLQTARGAREKYRSRHCSVSLNSFKRLQTDQQMCNGKTLLQMLWPSQNEVLFGRCSLGIPKNTLIEKLCLPPFAHHFDFLTGTLWPYHDTHASLTFYMLTTWQSSVEAFKTRNTCKHEVFLFEADPVYYSSAASGLYVGLIREPDVNNSLVEMLVFF